MLNFDSMNEGVSDEDLMLNYRNGDAASFDHLYRRHRGGLYRYILRKCGNASIADELFQDVWMKLIGARERYIVTAKFTTYLYQLANNRCIDYYRRQRTMISVNQNSDDCNVDDISSHEQVQPENKIVLQEQVDTLLKLLDELPEEQQEAFILREEAGMSVNEIAEVTGVNSETAKSRLRYAVKKLRAGLYKDD